MLVPFVEEQSEFLSLSGTRTPIEFPLDIHIWPLQKFAVSLAVRLVLLRHETCLIVYRGSNSVKLTLEELF